MSTVSPLGTPGTAPQGERAQLKAACQQFEAIFVRQMLAAARKASFGDELFGSGAVDTFREMQDGQFADIVAQNGSLGLATQIEAHVARFLPAEPAGTGAAATDKGK